MTAKMDSYANVLPAMMHDAAQQLEAIPGWLNAADSNQQDGDILFVHRWSLAIESTD
jgi:hypothetical protein